MKFLKFFILGILLVSQINCEGGECAASSTIITDEDADCIADGEDNCIEDYNPNQEDTDGDGFGDACDGDPDDAGVVDLNFMSQRFYNLKGLYEIENSTCPVQFFEIQQNHEDVFLLQDDQQMLSGKIFETTLSKTFSIVKTSLEDQNYNCEMTYFPKTLNFEFTCWNQKNQKLCSNQGKRTLIITN